jgi:ATPase subunit of ABC transporter with duplicated ATPase domains
MQARGVPQELPVTAKIDTFLKLSVIAAILLAGSSLAYYYYYAVYLPRRDAERTQQEMLEHARADAAKRAERERLRAQQQEAEQRLAQQQAAVQTRYQACLKDAEAAHTASRAEQCKAIADKATADRNNCLTALKLPKAYCESAYVARDGSPNCTLPTAVASVLDAALEQARNRCLLDSKSASP